MSLSEHRRHIDIAIAAGTQAKVGRSGQNTLSLRQNPGHSSYSVLSRADGSLTPAGVHYYKSTGAPVPSSQFNRGAPLVKKGAGDYVYTRAGKLALVRKLMPDGSVQVTRLGKLYFRGERLDMSFLCQSRSKVPMQRGKPKIDRRCCQSICSVWAESCKTIPYRSKHASRA